MSSGAPRSRVALPAEWAQLQGAVRGLLRELKSWQERAGAAERRVRELERTLKDVSTGTLDPQQLNDAVGELRHENEDLRGRLDEAGERVRALLSRIDFLADEEQA